MFYYLFCVLKNPHYKILVNTLNSDYTDCKAMVICFKQNKII